MKILVTGAAGFLGQRLIASLLAETGRVSRLTHVVAADLVPCPIADPRVESQDRNDRRPRTSSTPSWTTTSRSSVTSRPC